MNSVSMLCGPASPMCPARMDGVAMAADHCSNTTESHNWPCSWDARVPHNFSAMCGGVGGPAATHGTAPGSAMVPGCLRAAATEQAVRAELHIAVSKRSTRTAMVRMLPLRWATKWLYWSLVNQSNGRP